MHAIERRHGDRGPAVELNALFSRPIGIHCHEGVRPVGRHGRARFQQKRRLWRDVGERSFLPRGCRDSERGKKNEIDRKRGQNWT